MAWRAAAAGWRCGWRRLPRWQARYSSCWSSGVAAGGLAAGNWPATMPVGACSTGTCLASGLPEWPNTRACSPTGAPGREQPMSSSNAGRPAGSAAAGREAGSAEPTVEQRAAAAAVLRMISGIHISRAVYVAAELGIADHLADGPMSAGQLARATQAHEPSLYRVLRLLASLGVLAEQDDRSFGLTVLGERLRTGEPASVRSWAMLVDALGGAEPVKLNETSGGWIYPTGLLGLDGGAGLVEPHLGWQGRGKRAPSAEPVGPGGEGAIEDELAAGLDGPCGAVVDRGRGVEPDPGMAVLGVVVGEEEVAECACVLQGGEGAGEDGAVLEGLE